MLKFISYTALLIAIGVTGVLAYAATRPDSFQVARSLVIKAPPEKVFPMINDLRAFNTWNPFLKLDPATKLSYRGPASGVGSAHDWSGNSNVGVGSVEITESVPSSKIAMKLDMKSPMEAHNRVEFVLAPETGATRVTWAMQGSSPYLAKVISTFCNMDKMVGGSFEKGLADLKALAEK